MSSWRRTAHASAIVAVAALSLAAARTQDPPAAFAITNVTLIDGTGRPPVERTTIVVAGNRLIDVGPSARVPPGASVIDGTGKHVMPGLWDMHVHLTNATELAGPVFLANGVTGLRDCGGELEVVDWMRARFDRGSPAGPRVFRPGPFVDGPKPGVADRIVIATADEGRRVVGFLKPRGIDFIKTHNGPEPEPYFALLEEARRQGLRVVGHIPISVEPEGAIAAGHHSVEHVVSLFEGPVRRKVGAGMPEARATAEFTDADAKRLGALMAARGTFFDPTLIAYWIRSYQWDVRARPDPNNRYAAASLRAHWDTVRELPDQPDVRKRMDEVYRRFAEITGIVHRQGVRMLVGSDLGAKYVLPGFPVHEELDRLVAAGLTPMDALVAATRNSAESLDRLADLGTVETGKLADLVLLDADPLADIRHTRRIAAVVSNGRLFDRGALDAMLERVAADAPRR